MQYVERYHSNLKKFYLCAGFSDNGWSTQKCTSAQQIYYPTHQNAHLFFVTSYPHTPIGLPLPPPYVYTYANIILENDYNKQLTIFGAIKYTSKRTYLHKTNQRLIILLNMQSVVNCFLCFFSDACKVHFKLHAQSTLNKLNWQPQLWLYIN